MRRVLLAAAVLALAACGLDVWPYLERPETIEASPLSAYFQVINVATTVVEFRGFELYYKFYSRDQTRETGLGTREQLLAAQFRRVCSDSGPVASQVPPLVFVDIADRNTVFTTTAYFDAPLVPAYSHYAGVSPRDIPLRRSVEEFGSPRTFDRGSFVQTDADISAIWDLVQAQDKELHLVMYALSYGLKDLTIPLYSEARYLGFMVYYGVNP
jgi:hypothetical protein